MKTRIITLLLAISAIVIGGAYAQTKIKVHKGGEVIYSVPLTDVDSVGFAKVTSSVHNGHEFVDLGLPSGTKWATCNVGATTPEEYGSYFAWGETEPNTIYDWTTYKYCDGSGSRITKYATGYSYSNAPDGLTELEMTDDAAYINWGGSWRIPTEEEMTELIVNCNWTWVTQNGISGYKVTSTVNGNSIFLPATGAKGDGYVSNQEYAYYWTNSIRSIVNNSANALYCLKAYAPTSTGNLTRCTGASVRAVCNIDGGNTQTKVSIYKEDDVIYSSPIAEIDSIKFAKDYNGGISTEKYYRIKNVETGLYMNAANYDFHYTGSYGGVNCVAYAQDADQIFKFEVSGDDYKLKTNSGYYIYCQKWIVDAQTTGVVLSVEENSDATYSIKYGESYFALMEDKGAYFTYCDATESSKATWVLEEAISLPNYTISVSATEGGTATSTSTSIAQGGSITLMATPETGYRFVNWTVNGEEVSTENIFVASIMANTQFIANFEKRTTDTGISLTKEYRIKDVASGCYLNIANNYIHAGGPYGGVNCIDYAENNNQIFMFEASGNNYYLKSKSGYYIYCQQWNVDGLTYGSELTFIDNPDGTYYIKNGANYFKVELVEGVYYPYCDAPADLRATWVLEQVGGEEPEPTPTYTVSVSATEGGTVTTSAESVEEGGSVVLTATSEPGYRFVNWTLNNNVVSVSNPFIATITANSEFVANFEGVETEHEYVDLGLSVNWATCNVGANTPEEYGDYFAWGETSPKDYYYWSNYKYCYGDRYSMTKYCVDSEYGIVDNKTTLEPEDDAARVNWGGEWRMPTKAEQDELRNTDNCTWTWTTQNGVNGYKVTSKKNGNSIFLPAAGCRYESNLGSAGSYSYYGSSSLYEESGDYIYHLSFGSSGVYWGYSDRYYGLSVRPVCDSSIPAPTYAVAVSSTIGGTATASAESVEQGGSVTLTATANSGYKFVNWTLNGVVVSTENPYTATITANSEFVANFEEKATSGVAISFTQYFRIKDSATGKYLNASNYDTHTGGQYGGMNCIDYADSDDQKFMFEPVDTNYKLKTKSGYYIYCQAWNVDALTSGTVLTFEENGNGAYYIKTSDGYFKVEQVNGTYYPFCAASSSKKATWILEETGEATNQVLPTYTVEAKANTGGAASVSLTTVAHGESVILTATPQTGYIFNYWSKTGKGQVSTENPYTTSITANSQFYANFKKAVYTISVSATEGGTATTSAESVEHGKSVSLTATPNEGYVFKCWTLNGEVSANTKSNAYFSIYANSEIVAHFIKYADGVTGSENGHDYVDLGLPSGTRWATCNVGATTPEGKGSYFAWGETTPKTTFDEVTYKYYSPHVPTKYLLDPDAGWLDEDEFIDNKIALEASDDAATVNWGGKWRMPTKAEAIELVDYCTWTSWTQNGVSGYKVTSNINGNSIFLPKAGGYVGTDGAFSSNGWYYWTSSLDIDDNEYAYYMRGNVIATAHDRYRGQTIRAVCPAKGEGAPSIIVGVSSSSGGKASVSSNSVAKNGTVFLTATPNNGYAFKNWTLNGEVVSTESTYTATVTANISSYRHYVANFEDVSGKEHEYIDLGLPSGLKWATYNVGATSIYDQGDKFAWGETEVKNIYKWGTYKYCTGSWSYCKTITKYSTSRIGAYGPADGKDTLEPEDDAATVYWGDNWRMPTKAELKELYDNCTWLRTVKNGVYVIEGTSKINGNTICFGVLSSSDAIRLWSNSLPGNTTANGNDHENANIAVSLDLDMSQSFSGMDYSTSKCVGSCVRPVYVGEE